MNAFDASMATIDEYSRAPAPMPSLDLELLRVLHHLLEESSVTRAGRRLGLTQSTVSHALGRLREAFSDPLLVRAGRGLVLTPRAEALRPALARVLADIHRLVHHETQFDPARSSRSFALLCPDLLAAFLPPLLRRLLAEAPLVRLETRPPIGLDVEAALALGSVDVALSAARDTGSGLRQRVLGRVRFCVLARRGHPAVKGGVLDRAGWLAHPHVVVGTGGGGGGFVEAAVVTAGVRRRVGFVAPSFLAAPYALVGTDYLLAAPRELVAGIARQLRLDVHEPPIAIPRVRVAMSWHERNDVDPAQRWLRGVLADAVLGLLRAETA